ncbi:MAG: polymer-forming cytoskeletal protein [bacterium]|nr:polymer-forming cytoskeletal protein [bacterium]
MAKDVLDKELAEEQDIKTVLADDIEFNGNLRFSTSLKVKGKFEGEIDATGHLFIGKDADVKANIKARNISVYGRIKGNVEAFERLELFSGAELIGDIKTPDFIIQSGCVFNGNCIMVSKDKSSGNGEPSKEHHKEKNKG